MFNIFIHKGEHIKKFISCVSQLRLDMFREFPYLYQGTYEYEKKYMEGYANNSKSMLGLAYAEKTLAGVFTGMPLISDSEIVKDSKLLFIANNIDPSSYYYYGEVLVLPQFRRLRLPNLLSSRMDFEAKNMGFDNACFMAVSRSDDHPLKPKEYVKPDKLWERYGYKKMNLCAKYHWPTIHSDASVKDEENILEYWHKPLENNKILSAQGMFYQSSKKEPASTPQSLDNVVP